MTEAELSINVTKHISVLYVSNETDLHEIIKSFLERSGEYRVDTITSASEALKLSHLESYDFIVSDYLMPDMDGIAFLKVIRERFEEIPFILVMEKGHEKVVIEAIDNGVDGYIQKQDDMEVLVAELIHHIRQVMRRKQAETALTEPESRYYSFIEKTRESVCLTDEEGKVIEWNANSEKITGIPKKEAIGRYLWDLTCNLISQDYQTEERRKIIEQEIRTSLRTGIPVFNESSIIESKRQDGSRLFLRQIIFPIKTNKGFHFTSVLQDITREKQAEVALRKANNQLTLLASITRHDILNKISILYPLIDIAEHEFPDPELSDYLRMMKKATTEIQSQIEFTQVYELLGSQEPYWIQMNAIMPFSSLPDTITLFGELRDVVIFADPMLEQVFFNLLENSAMHGQHVSEIRVFAHESGSDLIVVWEDNGVGIAPGDKEKIFERGFGTHTGLGMFLIREILALTGMTISETGVQGKGARFEIRVPEYGWRTHESHATRRGYLAASRYDLPTPEPGLSLFRQF